MHLTNTHVLLMYAAGFSSTPGPYTGSRDRAEMVNPCWQFSLLASAAARATEPVGERWHRQQVHSGRAAGP